MPIPTDIGEYQPIPDTGIGLSLLNIPITFLVIVVFLFIVDPKSLLFSPSLTSKIAFRTWYIIKIYSHEKELSNKKSFQLSFEHRQ